MEDRHLREEETLQHALAALWTALVEGDAHQVPEWPEAVWRALEGAGWVSREGGNVHLTPKGHAAAAQAIRRRRLAERLLHDVLMTPESMWQEYACRMEHALVAGLEDSVCTLLGHPRYCPHGKPIPEGSCCRQRRTTVGRVIAPLSEMQPGQKGTVAYIQMTDSQRLQRLMGMGILPGVAVELLQRRPAYVFRAGLAQYAVDETVAAAIYVRLEPTPTP